MTETISTWQKREEVYKHVLGVISQLQNMYLSGEGQNHAARQLAELRRAVGKEPGSNPNIWRLEFENMPTAIQGKGSNASEGERAIHIALTLYAVHQQSRQTGMHCQGRGDKYDFGAAIRRLVACQRNGENLKEGELPRRFAAMITSDSIEELAHYARQLVGMLRAESIPFDYARFAGQLFDYQYSFLRDSVRLQWGRAYARSSAVEDTEAKNDESAE